MGSHNVRKQLFLVVSFFVASSPAWAAVTIDWVPVGNPNNAADVPSTNCVGTDCGSVDHAYYISKYETTNAQYAEFLNAKAASDPFSLFNPAMNFDANNGGIFQGGDSGSYTYTVYAGFENKPVTYVSFYDALRFANWLSNGKGSGDTETGAYTITPAGITNNAITRNPGAQIFLPSENEWYKAAFYSPAGVYFDYPAGFDAQTTCALPGATPNTANCSQGEPLAVTDVGAYTGSASPYGTFDQGGNVWEWSEITSGSNRGLRGGNWLDDASFLAASFANAIDPLYEFDRVGFRVASLFDWVPVGNPGNAADTASNCVNLPSDCGVVDHAYSIAQHETTNAQYAEFLNAKAASDPFSLYNASMGSDASNGGITQSGSSGSYTYAAKAGFANKPVIYVSFYDALRFANWLHNGKGSGDTETGAYTITQDGITNNAITRNPGAQIFLPSENEWYKAAYYSPGGSYFALPAGVDAQTTCALPGATPNTANCYQGGPFAVTDVGAYTGSASPYGTFDQGGNVWEWNERIGSGSYRGFRGGDWFYFARFLPASYPATGDPPYEDGGVGFRVASPVPEPGPGWLGMTAVLSLAAWRKRTAKAL